MDRNGSLTTTAGRVRKVHYGIGRCKVDVRLPLHIKELGRPDKGNCNHRNADALYCHAARDGFCTCVCGFLPDALPRRHDWKFPLYRHRNGDILRRRHSLQRDIAVGYTDGARAVCHIVDDTKLYGHPAIGVLSVCARDEGAAPGFLWRHHIGAAVLGICNTVQCGMGAAPRDTHNGYIYLDEKFHPETEALPLCGIVHYILCRFLLFGFVCAEQYNGGAPARAYQRAFGAGGGPGRRGI